MNYKLLWDVEEILKTRFDETTYIEGVGTLPQSPNQVKVLGLPFIRTQNYKNPLYEHLRNNVTYILRDHQYGAHWVIYKDDPQVVHGNCVVFDTSVETCCMKRLILLSRLGSIVNKKVAFAILSDGSYMFFYLKKLEL